MKRTVVILAILLVGSAAIVGGWWFVTQNPEWVDWAQIELGKAVDELGLQPEEEPEGLVASGFIEADEAAVTTELGGRIVTLSADEGEMVNEGDVLVDLDDSLLLAQIETAKSELEVAEAMLAQVQAGVQQETLGHAQSLVKQAEVAQEAAWIAWQDAQAMLESPQELEVAMVAARAQLGVLNQQVRQARAMADSAQVGRDLSVQAVQMLEDLDGSTLRIPVAPGVVIKKNVRLPVDVLPAARHEQAVATYQSWEAWTGLEQAEVARDGAEAYLAELSQQIANPLSLEAQVNAAKAQYEVATAAVDVAQAQVDGLKMGATPEQIAAVEAQVDVARSALDVLEVQLDKLTLEAPITGLVLARPVQVGEVALPGAPLMTLADLGRVTLTVYVPEDQLGKVWIGQPVSVTVDAYPERAFGGTVVFVASEAEFTPKNIQTREERVNMVFAVKVELPNPDFALKPGMPADALLHDEAQDGQ
jgi:multidrug efflux pump subunit AcrA (membrane-fusion protein)